MFFKLASLGIVALLASNMAAAQLRGHKRLSLSRNVAVPFKACIARRD
jgi:hypothetical protein